MVPLQLYIAVLVVTLATAIPNPNQSKKWKLCQKFELLYKQCLPPQDWICDKLPKTYVKQDARLALQVSEGNFLGYLKHSKECYGVTNHVFSQQNAVEEFRGNRMTKMPKLYKFPMCREVRKLVNYIYRPVNHVVTDVRLGTEICEVILSNRAQNIYKVECIGHKKTTKCRFEYSPQKDYYCRPTNYVTRTMVVLCPSDNGRLSYHVEKIPTACSCVKVGCDDTFTPKKIL
ncbi:unnamed protein product [Mytilus coruscus]|uniref:Spaetzle domain-containing protein n=1 Tax=Mytilus coruscus TaxID=42192 RepID=A0A6J8D5C1_MYTCO|nr:unnamed protein product [Mytilus coruscus]